LRSMKLKAWILRKTLWEKYEEYVCIICHKNSFKPCRKIRRK